MVTFKIRQIEKGKWYTFACIGIIYLAVFALGRRDAEGSALALKSDSPGLEECRHSH